MKWITFIFFTIPIGIFAQEVNCQWVKTFDSPLKLESRSIVPGSFSLSHQSTVTYDINTNLLTISSSEEIDSVKVCYTLFPVLLTRKVQNRTRQEITVANLDIKEFKANKSLSNNFLKSGIISRGMNMGNRQDLSVDSRMDLRLEGKITEDLMLRAHIFDQNIPYQPEGNTNSLKNFNRLHINVFNNNLALEAGDIQMSHSDYSFSRVNRGLMGAGIQLTDSTHSINIQTGINKGKFFSYQFTGEEGISGPYRVNGPVSDPYIIVLAGSEKLYMDGILLSRGVDYEIDYNLGEIDFLPSIIVTSFSIFRLDFEYMNQDYQRSSKSVNYEFSKNRMSFFAGYFSEKDNPLFQNNLSDFELEQIKNATSSPLEINSFETVAFDPLRSSYIVVDTVGYQDVLVYSKDPTKQHYKSVFTFVGENSGNYVKDYSIANESIYKWVEPDNGIAQGNYNPIKSISSPSNKQILTLGSSVGLGIYEKIYSEMSYSIFDANSMNTISPLQGIAIKGGISSEGRLLGKKRNYRLSTGLGVEWIEESFSKADPYREVNFQRDWGLNGMETPSDELLVSGYVDIKNKENDGFKWEGNLRKRPSQVDGWNSTISYRLRNDRLWVDSKLYLMRNDLNTTLNQWDNKMVDISVPSKYLRPGYKYRSERNMNTHRLTGNIESSLQYFDEHGWYVESMSGLKGNLSLSYTIRNDKTPESGNLNQGLKSNTATIKYNQPIKNGNISLNLNRRSLREGEQLKSETLLGVFSGNFQLLNGAVETSFMTSTASGWEPRREFIYIPVPNGQGHYTWRDLNGDGIQQLDEFFEAINIDERDYVRYFVNTPERIPAHENRAELYVKLRWPDSRKGTLLSKLHTTLKFDVKGKTIQSNMEARLSSIVSSLDDETVLSGKRRSLYRFYARDLFEIVSLDAGYQQYETKNWIQNGFELRSNDEWTSNISIKLNPILEWKISAAKQWKSTVSDVLLSRNYNFTKDVYGSSWEVRPSPTLVLESGYFYKRGDGGITEEIVSTDIHQITIDGQWKISQKRSLRLSSEYAFIDYKGNPNSALAYDLLEAFLPGDNLRITCSLQQELNSGIMIQLVYSGRKSTLTPLINRASIRASARF